MNKSVSSHLRVMDTKQVIKLRKEKKSSAKMGNGGTCFFYCLTFFSKPCPASHLKTTRLPQTTNLFSGRRNRLQALFITRGFFGSIVHLTSMGRGPLVLAVLAFKQKRVST